MQESQACCARPDVRRAPNRSCHSLDDEPGWTFRHPMDDEQPQARAVIRIGPAEQNEHSSLRAGRPGRGHLKAQRIEELLSVERLNQESVRTQSLGKLQAVGSAQMVSTPGNSQDTR
jgi:hypothetical protein